MAKARKKKSSAGASRRSGAAAGGKRAARFRPVRALLRFAMRVVLVAAALVLGLVLLFSVVNPPITHTMLTEKWKYGSIERHWVDLDDIAPVMARSAVAAEDANFCLHWGFDVEAIRAALAQGARRGGSTISQQVVKNVFLWQGRSWFRKVLEAVITPVVEAIWSKRRILEVYLNVAETGTGIFGVEAAARHYFGLNAAHLDAGQAALIAAILPNPRERSAADPSPALRKRAASVADGAATIAADGRAACFEAPDNG